MSLIIGPGFKMGAGFAWKPGGVLVTASGQNGTGTPSATGFFFAVLNRGNATWEYFAANGNNGTWVVTGNFGSGIVTIPVIGETHDVDSVFPVVNQGFFQPGSSYTFQGY